MGFCVYRAGHLCKVHEIEQMNKLIQYLKREFTNHKEDCTVVIEPGIPAKNKEGKPYTNRPDALIIKDNVFILIEMKNWGGNIVADCRRAAYWTRESKPLSEWNPFSQAYGHRYSLIDYLIQNFAKNSYAPSWARKDDFSQLDWIADNVNSWVVTAENSIVNQIGLDPQISPWFKAMPLERVPEALSRFHSEPILSPTETKRLIESLGGQLVHSDNWYRGPIIESPISAGLIPKIVDLVRSNQHDDVINGLKYIKELGLHQHIANVVDCWHDREWIDVRQEALLILIEWSFDKLGTVLNEALNDPKPGIVWFALDHLTKYGYIEPVPSLIEYLEVGVAKAKLDAIKGITISGSPSAGKVIFDYTKRLLSNQPFKKYQNWQQVYDEHYKKVMARQEDKAFEQLEAERSGLLDTSKAAIEALGDLNCVEAIPLLKQLITDPFSFGFPTNDYEALINYRIGYFGLFEKAIRTLGKLGIADKSVKDMLVSQLEIAPEDYQEILIQALGDIGDKSTQNALLPFVKKADNPFFYYAVHALSKMKADLAFDYIVKVYLNDRKESYGQLLENALANISPRRFEALLLSQLTAKKNSNEIKARFLINLGKVVSAKSAPTLFSLLKNPELADSAAAILSKVSRDEVVFAEAMKLTQSNDPNEQSLGIWVTDWYYLEDLNRLDKFMKQDAPVEIRRTVSCLLNLANERNRILEYANDPDDSVRRNVFYTIAPKASLRCLCVVAGTNREPKRCELALDAELLAIEFPNEVLILRRQLVTRGSITSNKEGIYGILTEVLQGEHAKEVLLIIPLDRYMYQPKRMSEEISKELKLSELTTDYYEETLRELWESATKLLPNEKDYGHA